MSFNTFGKIFNGKKLTKFSPNKTYSGAVGSIILSCSSLPLLNFFQPFFLNKLIIDFLGLNFLIFTKILLNFQRLHLKFYMEKNSKFYQKIKIG